MAHTCNPSTEEAQTSGLIPGDFTANSRPQRPCLKVRTSSAQGYSHAYEYKEVPSPLHTQKTVLPVQCAVLLFPVAVIKCPDKSNLKWGGKGHLTHSSSVSW